MAQQKSAADFYLPTLAKKFPPGRVSTCAAQCGNLQNELNKLWKKLDVHDFGTASDLRPWAAAMEANNPAAAKAAHDKMAKKWGDDNTKTEENGLQSILTDIAIAAARLATCEKKCAQAAQQPGGGKVIPPPEPPPEGPKKLTLPKAPDCNDPNFQQKKNAFLAELDALRTKVLNELGGPHGGGKWEQWANLLDSDPKKAKLGEEVEQLKKDRDAINKHQEDAEKKWEEKCPPKKSTMIFPGTPWRLTNQTFAVSTNTDSSKVCTFGFDPTVDLLATATNENFDPIPGEPLFADDDATPPTTPVSTPELQIRSTPTERPVAVTPTTPSREPVTEKLPAAPKDSVPVEKSAPPPKEPTEQAEKPEKPATPPPDKPVTTTEATPTDDIVILFKTFKGARKVLEQGQTGEPNKGQHLMLVFKKPEHRESGTGKPVRDDSGHDKDGVHGVTGDNGEAKLNVPAEDRALYLSNLGDKTNKYYRVDVNVMQNTGSVTEVTRNATPDLKAGAPPGGSVEANQFKIGNRTFVRRLHIAPYDVNVVLVSGQKIDECLLVEPAPDRGMEPQYPSALHRELPEATVKLPQARHLRRLAP